MGLSIDVDAFTQADDLAQEPTFTLSVLPHLDRHVMIW